MNSDAQNTSAQSAAADATAPSLSMQNMPLNFDGNGQSLRGLPFLDQYFGVWAMTEDQFLAHYEYLRNMNFQVHMQHVHLHMAQQPGQPQIRQTRNKSEKEEQAEAKVEADAGWLWSSVSGGYGYAVSPSGVAVVDISGALMKQESSAMDGTSTVMLRKTMRALARDPSIVGVMLRIDSPGGTVSGTADLADDVAALAQAKPVYAYVEDLTASAAYWIASQATQISAGRTSLVGSIGTYGVVYDMSAMASMKGIKVYVVKEGKFKGNGVGGTEVTAEQLGEMQRIVSGLNADFLDGVAKGRKMSLETVKGIADGRVHKAPDALKLGLIDQVESFDAAMTRLEQKIGGTGGAASAVANKPRTPAGGRSAGAVIEPARVEGPKQQENHMIPDANTPAGSTQAGAQRVAATAKEMQAAFADDPQFAMDQLVLGATLLEAKAAHGELLKTKLRARDDELEKLRQQNSNSNQEHQQRGNNLRPLGSRTVGRGGAGARTATEELAGGGGNGKLGPSVVAFNDAVREKMKLLNYDRRQAVVAVASEDPDLHRAYLEETNPNPKSRALIDDRFAGMA